jgi:hypothetical protein
MQHTDTLPIDTETTVTKPVPQNAMAKEPAVIVSTITAGVTAIIALFVAFGLDITDQQQNAILGVVAVAAPVIAGYIIRGNVYSLKSSQEIANDAAVTGVAADVSPPPPTKPAVDKLRWGINRKGTPMV